MPAVRFKLSSVSAVRLDRELFEYTHTALRELSAGNVEAIALWAGEFASDTVFEVVAVQIPKQRAIRSGSGLAVFVDDDELHRLNGWLYREGLQLVAQIHTHPDEAFHSDTDNAIPIVAKSGGLSLVIPNFARGPAELSNYAVYRLGASGSWDHVSPDEACNLLKVSRNHTEV